jgi:hypothetical protein
MVSVNAAGPGPERRIALVKPPFATEEQAGHAVQLFDSVLWVFKGTTRSNWVTVDAADADIIVAHHSEPAEHLDTWRKAGKLLIILSTDERNHPAGQRTLVYPFPAVQVLSMLERVEAELDSNNSGVHADPNLRPTIQPHANSSTANPSSADPWAFVEALRTLRAISNSSMWLVCKGPNGPMLWIRGDGSCYVCDSATAGAIRAGNIDLAGLSLQKGTQPPGNLPARAGVELVWFATYHASGTLAPWLNGNAAYRLIRWPDFGRVRAADPSLRAAQIRIVATLEPSPSAVAKLGASAQTTIEQTTRTLNALASCELIEVARSEALASAASIKSARGQNKSLAPPGGFKKFLSNLRRHLGLGAHS